MSMPQLLAALAQWRGRDFRALPSGSLDGHYCAAWTWDQKLRYAALLFTLDIVWNRLQHAASDEQRLCGRLCDSLPRADSQAPPKPF